MPRIPGKPRPAVPVRAAIVKAEVNAETRAVGVVSVAIVPMMVGIAIPVRVAVVDGIIAVVVVVMIDAGRVHMAAVIISIVVRCAAESAASSLQGPKFIPFAIPLIPGVLGDPAPQLDELLAIRVQRQGLVGFHFHRAHRTLYEHPSVKYLDVSLGSIQVHPEFSAFFELDFGALRFDFENVLSRQVDVEGGITPAQGQPVQFPPGLVRQSQLLEENCRVLSQAGGRAVFELHFGKAVRVGSEQEAFLNGIIKACGAVACAGGLKGNATLNETQPNDANVRHIVLGRQRGECRNCQNGRPNHQSVKSLSHFSPPHRHLSLPG
jgi:hypothetical protein